MFFNVTEARWFLLTNGKVYTLRKPRKRENCIEQLVKGSRYKHKSIGLGQVKLIRKNITHPRELIPYYHQSGFFTPNTWYAVAKEKSGERLDLYEVILCPLVSV